MEDLTEMSNSLGRLLRASQAMKLKFYHTSHLILSVIMELKKELKKPKKTGLSNFLLTRKNFKLIHWLIFIISPSRL